MFSRSVVGNSFGCVVCARTIFGIHHGRCRYSTLGSPTPPRRTPFRWYCAVSSTTFRFVTAEVRPFYFVIRAN